MTVKDQFPLHFWALNGRTEQIARLLIEGANVNSRDAEGNTPLHMAATSCVRSAIALLISHGANIEAKDNMGFTPLHNAVGANMLSHEVDLYLGAISELISAGANIFAQSNDGESVFDIADGRPYPVIREMIRNTINKNKNISTDS